MITPDMLQKTPGVWYVDTRLFNSTWEPGLTLKTTSFMSQCLYWHKKREMWSTDGCQVIFYLDVSWNLYVLVFFWFFLVFFVVMPVCAYHFVSGG